MRQHTYHREEADADAFDEKGILKDGKTVRTSLFMMDGLSPVQRAVAQSSAARVTDGEGGTQGLSRPGFRIADADAPLRARDAARADYERELTRAWRGNRSCADAAAERLCPDCDGSGEIDGEECGSCGGTGMPAYEGNAEEAERNTETHHEGLGRNRRRVDHRTVQQAMRDHQNKMADIYDKLDHELSETWRRS
jgi:DnaJ-class molecular chaperone